MRRTSPELEKPITGEDTVLAELTPEEQGFFRCMGYVFEEKVVDTLRLRALYETFWMTVRSLHNLPPGDLAVKEGKYIVRIYKSSPEGSLQTYRGGLTDKKQV